MSIMVQLEFPDGQTVLLTQTVQRRDRASACHRSQRANARFACRLTSTIASPAFLRGAFVTVSWYLPLTRAIGIWLDCPCGSSRSSDRAKRVQPSAFHGVPLTRSSGKSSQRT